MISRKKDRTQNIPVMDIEIITQVEILKIIKSLKIGQHKELMAYKITGRKNLNPSTKSSLE